LNKGKEVGANEENDFSSEVKILAKIYEYNQVKKEFVWFKKLKSSLSDELKNREVSKALDSLYKRGLLDERWENIGQGWARCFFVSWEAESLARSFFENIQNKGVE